MKRIAVFTSGGDAPGMNACIRAVVRTGLYYDMEVVGIKRGFQGMIDNDLEPLHAHTVSNILQLGGTILRSARSEEFRQQKYRKKAFDNLSQAGIEGIVAIGGDGTFAGADVFMEEHPEIPIVGCPGTIDNDLFGTDFTIGYDTAINTAMTALDHIKDTANAHDRLFFVEVMGRDAGFIALRAGISTGAEAVCIPESRTNVEQLIGQLEKGWEHKKNASIVVVAEGDTAGGAFEIAEEVKKRFHRYEIKVTVLGHIQRGGSPTCMERVRASRMGMEAVKALRGGQKGVMIGEVNDEIVHTPFNKTIKHTTELNPTLVEMVDILK